jgi:hypothetical protein
MTIEEFVTKYIVQAKWKAKGIDTDGAYGYQCMDLMHKYIEDVLGIPDYKVLSSPTAYQVYANFNNVYGHEKFNKIDNTPTGVPQKGDIIFFKQYTGLYGVAGHVCVYIDGDVNSIVSFDQNYPTGSLPQVYKHDYRGCIGWLRKR